MGTASLTFCAALRHTHNHAGTNTTVSAQTWGCKCYLHLPRGSAHLLLSYLLCYGCSGLTVAADRGMALLYRTRLFIYRWVSHLHVLRGENCFGADRGRKRQEWGAIRDPLCEWCQASLVSAGNQEAALKCCLCMCITEGPSALARQQAVHLDELQVNNCHLTSQSA